MRDKDGILLFKTQMADSTNSLSICITSFRGNGFVVYLSSRLRIFIKLMLSFESSHCMFDICGSISNYFCFSYSHFCNCLIQEC